ncbi:protamine-2-like [Phodopus roborovskii]|uniref:protamine-2-like n=1 Tax=Phodopus roborovskii TaxID=109678 RepID=UPI0021E4AAF2|nr:protamine-2-like [Phodopus roborovskii]
MVRYRVRSPSERPRKGPGQEHEDQGQGLSPEHVEDYGRTHRGHHHHRHRRCSRRRLHRIHKRRRSCRRRRHSCRHRRRHRRGSLANQNFLSQRLQKIPQEEEMQVQEV